MKQMKSLIRDDWGAFEEALNTLPETSVRINDKLKADDLRVVEGKSIGVPWCADAYYLAERPNFTLDPLFHAGAYYVQEASSMFVEQALMQYVDKDSLVLDMCAAPGGKSTLISQYLSKNGFLVSNEYVSQRAHILAENITKWGNPNCAVTNNTPEHFERYGRMFDAILVDAPCSGEGMFRKDERAIEEWSMSNVEKCVVRQRDILKSAIEALAEDGILIYSTCTYNVSENEDNIAWLMCEHGMELCELEIDEAWNIIKTDKGYRFMPHKTKGEGLFLSVLRKTDSEGRKYKYKKGKQKYATDNNLLKYVLSGKDYTTLINNDIVYAVQKHREELMMDMLENMNVFTFGVPLVTIKGKSLIPHAALALSKVLNEDAFVTVDLDRERALLFLRTESLMLEGVAVGYVLIKYMGVALGWMKNIGNRSNNMYPSNWRIRMNIK